MWQQTFCLILSVIITGSLPVFGDMTVSPVVFVPRGEDAILSCSFTHSKQQDYSGKITVKWLARESRAPPFILCPVKNDSTEELCSFPELKYSLQGDPRRGELSLLIRRVHLSDNGTYFCRVELDRNSFQKKTQLYVTVKPQILNLSVVESSSGSDSASRRLRCEVEGHPLPTVTWLSASRSLLKDQVQTSAVSPHQLVSSVPYLEQDVFTCRVENMVGGAERRYPASYTLMITALTVCGLVVLLLLSAGFIVCRRNRVENHRLHESDCPVEGDAEVQLVYTAVSEVRSTSSQQKSLRSSAQQQQQQQEEQQQQQQEPGVVYSPVNIQSRVRCEGNSRL